jgi:hypothetical protein
MHVDLEVQVDEAGVEGAHAGHPVPGRRNAALERAPVGGEAHRKTVVARLADVEEDPRGQDLCDRYA